MDKDVMRRHVRTSAQQLVKLLDLNAPNIILANQVMTIFRRTLVAVPELADEYGKWQLKHARMGCGVCVDCGQEQAQGPNADYADLCKECAERLEAEAQDEEYYDEESDEEEED